VKSFLEHTIGNDSFFKNLDTVLKILVLGGAVVAAAERAIGSPSATVILKGLVSSLITWSIAEGSIAALAITSLGVLALDVIIMGLVLVGILRLVLIDAIGEDNIAFEMCKLIMPVCCSTEWFGPHDVTVQVSSQSFKIALLKDLPTAELLTMSNFTAPIANRNPTYNAVGNAFRNGDFEDDGDTVPTSLGWDLSVEQTTYPEWTYYNGWIYQGIQTIPPTALKTIGCLEGARCV
jgi:hypothetical protein